MSRVDEALKRAAAVPRSAVGGRQVAERPAERWDPSLLAHYPLEERTPREGRAPREELTRLDPIPGQAEKAQVGQAVSTGQSTDRVVSGRFSEAYQGKLVANGFAPPSSIEQYRRLAATLHHLQVEQGLKRLMVSSAVPKEGKTLTVVNLAMTLSESYKRRVLLIDADMRRPSVHEVFGISNRYGLGHALRAEHKEIQFARVSPNLWVLPAGPPDSNPMGALSSQRMERLLDEVESSFDWILIDAPPVALMADAGLLARLTRAVIVVIRAGSTPYSLVEKVVAELGRENIIGAVLNQVEESRKQWSEYYSTYGPTPGRSSESQLANFTLPDEVQKGREVVALKSPDTTTFDASSRYLPRHPARNIPQIKHLLASTPLGRILAP